MIQEKNGRRFLGITFSALFAALFFFTIIYSPTSFAKRIVEVTGSAPIFSSANQAAKEQAIRNAMQQALLQTSAHIDSTSTISANVLLIDSSRINTSGTVQDVKILEEWIDDEIYYVRIRAHIPDEQPAQKNSSTRYRKKIAAIQFDIINRAQTHDLVDIERELPREILRRLENSGEFITIDATQYLVSDSSPAFQFDNPGSYKTIAEATGSQIILSGQIRDMRVETGFFSDTRFFEIEIYLHDGISGVRLSRHRFSEVVKDSGYFKNRQNLFSSSNVRQSIFGKTLNRIITSQVELLRDDLSQIPFSAKILKIEGSNVYFNAGASSQIRVGDVLMTYRLEADPLLNSNKYVGYIESPAATLTVEHIQPLFSKGKLEIKNPNLMVGDIVRFGR